MKWIDQVPTPPNEWLYKEENGVRDFFKFAHKPDNVPPYPECTEEEKNEWEDEHLPKKPEEVE